MSQSIESTLHFNINEQATVWTESDNICHPSVIPFLLALSNILVITLKTSFKENRIVGYEYVNEKAT
jgi:hypothetical protein